MLDSGMLLLFHSSYLLDNWVRELKLWCPSLKVLVYYGKARHSFLSIETLSSLHELYSQTLFHENWEYHNSVSRVTLLHLSRDYR